MLQHSFQALGTTWWIEVWDETNAETASEIFDFASRFCTDFEQSYSRFLPDSEISRLNRERTLIDPSEQTRALLAYGVELYRRTRGTFNFLTGHILEARGYDDAYSFIDKGSAELKPGNPVTDLIISKDVINLKYGNIDLGGYGKGYLIDLLAQELKDQFGLLQFLINGGGDMYVTQQADEAFEIHLEDPLKPGTMVKSVYIKDCGFAASSPHKRSWPRQQTNPNGSISLTDQNHIVSQTTQPTKDVIYLTAPTCAEADAFATTLLQVDDVTAQRLAEENKLTIL